MFWRRAKSLVAAAHWTTAPQSSRQQPIHYINYAILIHYINPRYSVLHYCYVLSMSLSCDHEKPVFLIALCRVKLGFLVGVVIHWSWMQRNLLRSSAMSACNECNYEGCPFFQNQTDVKHRQTSKHRKFTAHWYSWFPEQISQYYWRMGKCFLFGTILPQKCSDMPVYKNNALLSETDW